MMNDKNLLSHNAKLANADQKSLEKNQGGPTAFGEASCCASPLGYRFFRRDTEDYPKIATDIYITKDIFYSLSSYHFPLLRWKQWNQSASDELRFSTCQTFQRHQPILTRLLWLSDGLLHGILSFPFLLLRLGPRMGLFHFFSYMRRVGL